MIEQDGFAESVGHLHVIVCCVPACCRDAFVFDAARARTAPPYRDGTTHIVLEPLDLMARLAALVPARRVHPTGAGLGSLYVYRATPVDGRLGLPTGPFREQAATAEQNSR
jgi:hypothetical protein